MALTSGSRVGPYEILAPLGKGGMGEVYRARDPRLGRDVAIKVLPETFSRDAERMARFQREAKVLASLNQSNIATIHGLEDSGGARALVMELVEGPTLADRIKQGPIPVEEAVRIAKQLCEALEYAHEHGIIHRDLKPANVKLTNDGAVKVLDFGLAKALEGDASEIDIANSPTLTRMATQAGVLLGTAAYMSPEQAKGRPVDRRADIWAFGCVLYEMLTGKMAFQGETVTDTLAAVIMKEPDWSQLPANTPPRVRVLLQRCLQKDPKQRLRDIGDARISLDEVISGAPESAPSLAAAARPAVKPWPLWIVSGAAGLLALAAALFAFLYFHQKPPQTQAVRFEIPLPEKTTGSGPLAVSPDGSKLTFVAAGADGLGHLWVRSLDTLESRSLDDTEGATDFPFWSPDSRFIGFLASGKLKKVEATGGPPITLCDTNTLFGGAWTRDDKILFGTAQGIREVSASGGSSRPVTTDGPSVFPWLLPDGRHFVYWRASSQGGGIYVRDIEAKPEEPSSKLLEDESPPIYAPSSDPAVGYLLFVRGSAAAGSSGVLMAQPFNTRTLHLTGDAVPVAQQISNLSFSVSAADVLAYMGGAQDWNTQGSRGNIRGQLTWLDREGKILGAVGDPGVYRTLALSPDGKQVAFERADPQSPNNRNIWLYDFARGVTTRFTFDSAWDSSPVWSPDGSRIVFCSNRGNEFDLYQKTSNLAGEDELLFKSSDSKIPTSWSPDGRFLLFQNPTSSKVWILPLTGAGDHKPVPLEQSQFSESYGKFSPDGRWIAYTSDESGKSQIYVQPFDAAAATGSPRAGGTQISGKWMVSKDGGSTPMWGHDGKELFYLSLDGMAMAVDVNTTGIFQAGIPKQMFKVPPGALFWSVTADGKRFLMVAPLSTGASAQPKFTVVLNWQADLKR